MIRRLSLCSTLPVKHPQNGSASSGTPQPLRRSYLYSERFRSAPRTCERFRSRSDARLPIFLPLACTLARLCDQVGPRAMRGTGVERWFRVIFEHELDRFRDVLAKGLCRDPQREIEAGRDAAAGYHVAVDDHPFGNRRGAKSWQHVVAHPVSCGTLALEQSGSSQDECAGAHARHVASTLRMTPDEGERLRVIEEQVHPCAPRHADQIERRALRECGGRQNLHASVHRHRLAVLPHKMDLGIRKSREDLVGAGQVELGDVGEEQEADVERHSVPPKLGRVPVSLPASNKRDRPPQSGNDQDRLLLRAARRRLFWRRLVYGADIITVAPCLTGKTALCITAE